MEIVTAPIESEVRRLICRSAPTAAELKASVPLPQVSVPEPLCVKFAVVEEKVNVPVPQVKTVPVPTVRFPPKVGLELFVLASIVPAVKVMLPWKIALSSNSNAPAMPLNVTVPN